MGAAGGERGASSAWVPAAAPLLPGSRAQPASSGLPLAPSPYPIPTSLPTRSGMPPSPISPILTQVPHPLPTSTPPCLIFTPSQSFLSPSISSPSPPLLSSPSYLHSDFLSHSHSQTPPPTPSPYLQRYLFSGSAASFSGGGNLPFCACRSPPGLWLQPPSRGWRAPSAGHRRVSQSQVLQLNRTRHFRPNLAFREEGRKGGTLALHPRSGLEKSGKWVKWVILLAGPFSSPPEAL